MKYSNLRTGARKFRDNKQLMSLINQFLNIKMFSGKMYLLFISISTVPILLSYVFKKIFRKKVEALSEEDTHFYHQLLAVDMKNFNCRPHLLEINSKECEEWCSIAHQNSIRTFVSTAKFSICVCMYMLTLKSINYELIKAHRRGVVVRVITDKIMLQTTPEMVNFSRLSENGIPYKVQDDGIMHHKFCLIDKDEKDDAKMFFGSLNLTTQGLCSNFDSLVLTNNIHIIKRFSDEFEKLWNLF